MKLDNKLSLASLLILVVLPETRGFRSLFRRRRPPQTTASTTRRKEVHVVDNVAVVEPVTVAPIMNQDGVDMNIFPDLDALFGQIQKVSPLAKLAIGNEQNHFGPSFDVEGSSARYSTRYRGFEAVAGSDHDQMWKTIETNRRGPVTRIDRIDSFNGLEAPLLRFRGSLEGPCEADLMASLIMDLEERSKWDIQIEDVYEALSFHDLAAANAAMGFAYGDCYRLGLGYCRTKKNLGIDAREQLTVCGINRFSDGSRMIWGVELDESHDDLLPSKHSRVTRAKSHLFSTTIVPTGESSFDFEYTLQLEIGGKIPTFLTTPIVTDSVKRMFRCAKEVYAQCENERSSASYKVQDRLVLSP